MWTNAAIPYDIIFNFKRKQNFLSFSFYLVFEKRNEFYNKEDCFAIYNKNITLTLYLHDYPFDRDGARRNAPKGKVRNENNIFFLFSPCLFLATASARADENTKKETFSPCFPVFQYSRSDKFHREFWIPSPEYLLKTELIFNDLSPGGLL